ncbi:hypothetical protein A6770_03290 [Nostoc minutum NIES-26]|uniref:DUF2808 domain-containing protein n=1 Tax=Nostoc minutum NIES-26 TaxID=1844469 RepID=A0A367QKX1_9NOSO|nr:hypothetical protein [Dendronalium sp. ChiSLP03b]RCJ24848.1 hypothetical protein A6770_03290 [Nostoc minutum NIES-26]
MKGLICGSLSALILTTSTAAIATPVKYEQSNADRHRQSQVAFNVDVPHITHSGVRNDTHFIRVAVVGMSLQDLMISLPSQMERFNGVRIQDRSGREIAAKTEISKERLSITFDQPVNPGSSVEVQFTGVQTRIPVHKILLYGVTAKRVGLAGDIPIGTARIDLPDKG